MRLIFWGYGCDEAGEDRLVYFCVLRNYLFGFAGLVFAVVWLIFIFGRCIFCNNRVIRVCSYIFDVLTVGLLPLFVMGLDSEMRDYSAAPALCIFV